MRKTAIKLAALAILALPLMAKDPQGPCVILKRMGPADQVTSHLYAFGTRGKQFQFVEGQLTPTPDQVQAMIQRLRAFIVLVNSQVQQETQAWVVEFQTSLADLEKTARMRAQEQKPSSMEITITNAAEFDSGVTVSLDGMDPLAVDGKSCVFRNVAPGPHIVLARGSKSGKVAQQSDIVRVQPDAPATVSITIPTV
jgi:hypothetical protein